MSATLFDPPLLDYLTPEERAELDELLWGVRSSKCPPETDPDTLQLGKNMHQGE